MSEIQMDVYDVLALIEAEESPSEAPCETCPDPGLCQAEGECCGGARC